MLYADDINLFLLFDLYIQNEGLLNNLTIECTDQGKIRDFISTHKLT